MGKLLDTQGGKLLERVGEVRKLHLFTRNQRENTEWWTREIKGGEGNFLERLLCKVRSG